VIREEVSNIQNIELVFAKQSFLTGSVVHPSITDLKPGTLHLGYTNYANHWMSKLPSNFINGMWGNQRPLDQNDEHRKIWTEQSKKDLVSFLDFRADELMPGGILVMGIWASDTGRMNFPLYDAMATVKAQFMEEGVINEDLAMTLCPSTK